jgi:tungstate transport system substrate-binding protein
LTYKLRLSYILISKKEFSSVEPGIKIRRCDMCRVTQIRKGLFCHRAYLKALIVVGLLGFCSVVFSQEYKQIVVATGSPFELGLVNALAEAFQAKYGGIVRCVKTPTGPGLDLGRNGLAHITMGHEKEATQKFVDEGNAARRVELMHNFTLVVGPADDPAKITGLTNLGEAHRRIFWAKAPYLSRGDGGGMHMLELKTWESLSLDPRPEHWYEVSKTFMLASLRHADKNRQYHMLDSSTWTLHKSEIKGLKLLVKGPPNQYEMCLVSASKHPNLKYNEDMAEKFYEFLISNEGQKIIADFGIEQYGEPVYYPNVIENPK